MAKITMKITLDSIVDRELYHRLVDVPARRRSDYLRFLLDERLQYKRILAEQLSSDEGESQRIFSIKGALNQLSGR